MNPPGHFGHVISISTYTYARARARVYVLIVSSCPKCPGAARSWSGVKSLMDGSGRPALPLRSQKREMDGGRGIKSRGFSHPRGGGSILYRFSFVDRVLSQIFVCAKWEVGGVSR